MKMKTFQMAGLRQLKKLRRIESCEEEYEMQEWWKWVEERCIRA